jgi:putative glycerol-1-phosphate prenyltransferase
VKLPVLLFPGSPLQICPEADGILFLSLISGRNPEFLIGQHVVAAPFVKQCGLQVFSVGYMLIGDENISSVSYMSGTVPIPSNKPEIAVATAMAGEMLGLGAIYLEAGSGAGKKVPAETISAVAQNTKIPVIVGGGMKTTADIKTAFKAGADIVVVGTAVEKDSAKIRELAKAIS